MNSLPNNDRDLASDPRVQELIVRAVVAAEIEAYQLGFRAGNEEGFTAGRQAGFEDGYAAYEAELAGAMPAIPDEIIERNRLWAEYNLAEPAPGDRPGQPDASDGHPVSAR